MSIRVSAVLITALLASLGLFPVSGSASEPAALVKKTYTFKTVGDLKIQADVYRPDDTKLRPVVVWIHGGALIVGNRLSVPKQLLDLCKTEGYVLVSIDYRLAPEVKLPEIIADLDVAYRWIHDQGQKIFQGDPGRIVITGGSAGGYLTLMTGVRAKPRPRALVAYWGYGDVDGDWFVRPSEHYRKQKLVDKEEAFKQVGGKVVTGSEPDLKARGRFYLYLRQNGLWTKEVTGFDPVSDKAKLDPYCPVRNVTAQYPPTILIHGTEDTDVPYELSAAMAKEFTRHKVPYELVTVPGAGHGLAGGDKKLVQDANQKALAFIRKHLAGESNKRSDNSEPRTPNVGIEYYPLKEGAKWHYKIDVNAGAKQSQLVNRVAKIDNINGEILARVETVLPNGTTAATEHLAATTAGVFRHRFNGMELTPPLCILKYPLKIGEIWETKLKTGGVAMLVKCRVGREKIDVPAGKYTAFSVHIDTEVDGTTITTTYWFAAGVGIVKQTTDVGMAKVVIELEKHEPGK